MGSDKTPKAMYMDDVDETSGKPVRGTRRSASTKEKPRVSQRDSQPRKNQKSTSDSGLTTGQAPGASDASSPEMHQIEVVSEKESKHERRKSLLKSPRKAERRSSTHGDRPKTSSQQRDDPAHYGAVATPARTAPPVVSQPIPLRPRAMTSNSFNNRPVSYHASYSSARYGAPPISNSAYWQQQQLIPPSYPPPSQGASYMRYAAPIQQQQDYFARPATRPLSHRFDPPARTTSAYGVHEAIPQATIGDTYDDGYYDDGYALAAEGASIRRCESASIRVPSGLKTKAEQDYEDMPPPPRPGILRRPFTDGAYVDSERPLYRSSRAYDRHEPSPRPSSRRPSMNRNSVSYDLGIDNEGVRVEPANSGRRRQSYYGQSASTGSYEQSTGSRDYQNTIDAKIRDAMNHQEDIGGPSVPLTSEMLRRQQRHAGSSRSTKSSGSRDESDYRKSATTRTTRSGSTPDDENVTIKVTGQARVVIGGAQIDCQDGGEIQIKRRESIRNGSERSTSEYGQPRLEDRKSRAERQSERSRMSSRSSYTRMRPQIGNGVGNFF